ncbi:TetR/AcrR family transcriptional regulator [Algoriphagus sp.]|uniref:TetR/AcrR family transcriptional regulator n=1 Tax=Algoriphagus sp. TaxID=1872435 RepID=UPI003F6F6C02
MNNTKNNILESALRLFNEAGVAQVSLRTIATDMGISLGNLTYHFKKREEIIDALYLQLVEKLDQAIQGEINQSNHLQLLFELPSVCLISFYEYRFLMLDFVYINRNHAMIRGHYSKLLEDRAVQFHHIVQELISGQLIREEIIENEYLYLFRNLRIVSDFWLSATMIDKDNKLMKKDIAEGAHQLRSMIFPYLTVKGRDILGEFRN